MTTVREYHERTKHSVASVHSNRHFLDWSNQPLPFKVYTSLDPIPLPRDLGLSNIPALEAIAATGPRQPRRPLPDLRAVARLLHYSAGITRKKALSGRAGDVLPRRGLHRCALPHRSLPGVRRPAGPARRGLPLRPARLLRCAGCVPATIARFWSTRRQTSRRWRRRRPCWCAPRPSGATPGSIRRARTGTASGTTARSSRTCWRSRRPTGCRRKSWSASSTSRSTRCSVSTRSAKCRCRCVALGDRPDLRPGAAPRAAAAGIRNRALSAHEVDYPLDPCRPRRVRAGDAGRGARLARRRRRGTPARRARRDRPAAARASRRRVRSKTSSCAAVRRAASRTPRSASRQLSTAAVRRRRAACRPIGSPRRPASLDECYLIANAVDGLRLGVLRVRSRARRRSSCSRKAISAATPATSISARSWRPMPRSTSTCSPISIACRRALGERGYRAAALEAAIVGGKLYLASYALGLGATGLTFFDDDVTEFFSPHAAGKGVMFLVATGVPGRRRGSRSALRARPTAPPGRALRLRRG